MKLFLAILLLSAVGSFAQSNIKMQADSGAENDDLQSLLYFENIGFHKLSFSGSDLKNKDFQVTVKEFVSGKLAKTDVVFDSKVDEYFKIKDEKFGFRIMARRTAENTVRMEFQFNRFRQAREYKVDPGQKEFALKDFVGAKPDISIPLNTGTYIATYMLPYVLKNGATEYCDVVESGVKPEELGVKFSIPRYYLVDIKFQ